MTDRLFVYGTLAPGRDAWPVLEPWVVGDPQPDAVAGALYDTGRGYPGAQFGDRPHRGDGLVHGSVVTLDAERAAVALERLDRYEGDEYVRIAVRTVAGIDAATYAWVAEVAGSRLMAGGRWPEGAHPETRPPRGR